MYDRPGHNLHLVRNIYTAWSATHDEGNITVLLSVTIPSTTAPSSAVQPILIEHHVCFTLELVSASGQSSSVECKLPVHILDHRLLPEAVAATMESRVLALGSASGRLERGQDGHAHTPPCYPAHVQDRVF